MGRHHTTAGAPSHLSRICACEFKVIHMAARFCVCVCSVFLSLGFFCASSLLLLAPRVGEEAS